MNLITAKKFKAHATVKLNRIDELSKNSVTKDEFRESIKEMEERFSISQTEHVKRVHTKMEEIQKDLKK